MRLKFYVIILTEICSIFFLVIYYQCLMNQLPIAQAQISREFSIILLEIFIFKIENVEKIFFVSQTSFYFYMHFHLYRLLYSM